MNISSLQKARYEYAPKLPGMLRNGISDICVCEGAETQSVADQEKIKALFPNTYGKKEITFQKGTNTSEAKKQIVGVILSGGQAPGGHNVICGLYDALKATNPENELYGFKGGPSGLIEDNYLIFTDEYIDQYRNTGGFDIIGSGRTKLETAEQFAIVAEVCKKHGITAIAVGNGTASKETEIFTANLLKEIDSRMNIGVFARYNYQITPVIENWNVQSDMVIDTKFTSFGATCAPLGETLGEDYVQKKTTCGHNHLSVDGVVDASTCLFPEYTWFIKDIQHSFGMREMEELRDLIFNSEKQVTVHDYEKFPQFIKYNPADAYSISIEMFFMKYDCGEIYMFGAYCNYDYC